MGMGREFLDAYINKTAPFKFMGRGLAFRLSQGLFSSFDVDDGSKLLLKTIAQRIDLPAAGSALDLGCGAGIIGICVNKAAPHISTVLQDRDALAVAFAEMNAAENKCAAVSARCGLAFDGLEGKVFDLLFSNLPAKAGLPVLESIFRRIPSHLAESGTAAVVVIDAISDFARRTVDSLGFFVSHTEKSGGYTVIHFRPNPGYSAMEARADYLASYIRKEFVFSSHGTSYSLETVFNLPDFDTLGHQIELVFDALSDIRTAGRLLFWNPGQGHIPVFIALRQGKTISEVYLCGRDSLEIAIARRNMEKTGVKAAGSAALACESLMSGICTEKSVDFLCAVPRPVPRVSWQAELIQAASRLLKTGGSLLVTGKSTEIHRLMSSRAGFAVRIDRKRMGNRVVLLTKT
jgi:16S rRNA G1207 methylase RsmC